MAHHVIVHLLGSVYSNVHGFFQGGHAHVASALQNQWTQPDPAPAAAPAGGAAHPNLMGCVDSPEAPTGLLLMVGATGIAFGSSLVRKLGRRKQASESSPAK